MDRVKLLQEAELLVKKLGADDAQQVRFALACLRSSADPKRLINLLEYDHFSDASRPAWAHARQEVKALAVRLSPDELAYVLGWAWRIRPKPGSRH